VDGNYFISGAGGQHELKFGFGYRQNRVTTLSGYGGDQLVGYNNAPGDAGAWIARSRNTSYLAKYIHGYLGDTFSKDRFTLNIGVRVDHQVSDNSASSAPGNAAFPDVLPALDFAGGGTGISFNDVSPRVGITYALDDARKTVVRASYGRYAAQLLAGQGNYDNPVRSSYLAYDWHDLNNDGFVQRNEVDLGAFRYAIRVDPANPAAVGKTVNQIDPNLTAQHDTEFIVGLDRELAPNFALSTAFTWKRINDVTWEPRTGFTVDDFAPTTPVTSGGFTVQPFAPDPALVTASGNGRTRTNRPDYHQQFKGIEVNFVKRLSNKWMGRLAFSYNDWTEHWSNGVTPTDGGGVDASVATSGNPTRLEDQPLVQGGQVSILSGGSGKASFFSSVKWQLFATALVQLPADFELSAAFFGKQGGPFPNNIRASLGQDGTRNLLVNPKVDSQRYDTLVNLDLRLAKNLRLSGDARLVLTVEAFNVFNNDLVLSQFRQVNSSAFQRIEEIISPRVVRFGARFAF
jgi:hypothetical protein